MQQADKAGSTRSAHASPGNTFTFSQTIVLDVAKIDGVTTVTHEARVLVDKLVTLVRVADETIDEAIDDRGFWSREQGYERSRMRLVSNLLELMDDELRRLSKLLDAGARRGA